MDRSVAEALRELHAQFDFVSGKIQKPTFANASPDKWDKPCKYVQMNLRNLAGLTCGSKNCKFQKLTVKYKCNIWVDTNGSDW